MDNQNRVSVSLCISDEKLYKSFITPYKKQRQLNNVILMCLKAYFYDPELRQSILDFNSNGAIEQENASLESIKSKFRDIHNTIAMQNLETQQVKSIIEDGQEMTQDILHRANSNVRERGYQNQDTTSGSEMLLPGPVTTQELLETEKRINARIDDIMLRLLSNKEVLQSSSDVDANAVLQQLLQNTQETTNKETTETNIVSTNSSVTTN